MKMITRCKNHKELGWDDEDCNTCKSLTYHKEIYKNLNKTEQMEVFKKRCLIAFQNVM